MAVAARRTRTGYKQRYSSNTIQPTSAGRKNQAEQTSINGRYYGSRQTYTNPETGKVARKGQNVTRETQYRDTRAAFNNMTEGVARAMLNAGQMTQQEYNRMHGAGGGSTGSLGLAVG